LYFQSCHKWDIIGIILPFNDRESLVGSVGVIIDLLAQQFGKCKLQDVLFKPIAPPSTECGNRARNPPSVSQITLSKKFPLPILYPTRPGHFTPSSFAYHGKPIDSSFIPSIENAGSQVIEYSPCYTAA
jgi:hypothetical protein